MNYGYNLLHELKRELEIEKTKKLQYLAAIERIANGFNDKTQQPFTREEIIKFCIDILTQK